MRHLIGMLTAATLLAGCTAYSTFDPLQTSGALLSNMGAVTLKTTFRPGGYTTGDPDIGNLPLAYRTSGVVPNHTTASVEHLRLALFILEGGAEISLKDASGSPLVKILTAAEAEAGFKVDGLVFDKTYRARATAYKAPEATASNLISAEGMLEFKLDKSKSTTEFSIQLTDVPFSGAATSSGIVVTPNEGVTHEGPVEILPNLI